VFCLKFLDLLLYQECHLELAAQYYEEALATLKPFGDKAYYLAGMAELMMTRSH
jgi:hypothetical protein